MCGQLSNYLFLFMFFTHVQDCQYRHIFVDGLILSPVFVYTSPLCVLPTRLREQTVTFLETTLNCAFKVYKCRERARTALQIFSRICWCTHAAFHTGTAIWV